MDICECVPILGATTGESANKFIAAGLVSDTCKIVTSTAKMHTRKPLPIQPVF